MMVEGSAVPEVGPPSDHPDEAIRMIVPHPVLSMTIFGPLTGRGADGNDLLPRVRKTRALLAILAMAAPQPVPRAQIIALLWSRRGKSQAQGSLRQATHELRIALGSAAELLRAEAAHLALSDVGLQLDARLIMLATPAQPDPLAMWRAEMLSDLVGLDPAFDRWLSEQLRCLWQRVRALGEMVLAETLGADATAAAAERLLTIDAAHEGAWRAMIRVHVERGDRAAAVAAFERCRAALSAQCQVVPSAETMALMTALRAPPAVMPKLDDAAIDSPGRPRFPAASPRIRLGVAPLRGGPTAASINIAAGLTEELIVALSRFRWLACVTCAADAMAREVDYRLDGTVQQSGGRLRVLLHLTSLHAGGEVVWAERFDHGISDIFSLQDRLASITAARLEPSLWLWEGAQIAARGQTSWTAQDLLRLAVPALHSLDRRGFLAAGRWLDQSVELEPDNAAAHAWAAQWHMFSVGQGWATDPAAGTQRAHDLAERAIRLDPEDARALTLAGHVRGFIDHRTEEALRLHERAIAANPNLPLSWCLSGLAHSYNGDRAAAISQIGHAQSLSPHDPLAYFFEMGLAVPYLLEGDYATSVRVGQRAIALNSNFSSTYKTHLAALGHLGDIKAAADTRALLLALEPGFTIEAALRRSPITDRAGRVLYAEGLRLGGLV